MGILRVVKGLKLGGCSNTWSMTSDECICIDFCVEGVSILPENATPPLNESIPGILHRYPHSRICGRID